MDQERQDELRHAAAKFALEEHLKNQPDEINDRAGVDYLDMLADEDWQTEGDEWKVISMDGLKEGHLIVTFKPDSAEIDSVKFNNDIGLGLCLGLGDEDEE
jgi:hypothetical protein